MKQIFSLLVLTGLALTLSAQDKIDPKRIDIVRDHFGVPHIFAPTDREVAYGLAWAEAEDDFNSIQDVLLPVKGVMGRVQGKAGAAGDYAFALFRCKELTEEKWSTLSPEFLKLIDGYTQGINAYAAAHPKEVMHKKLFPVTPKEYVSSSVLALIVFNGAGDALGKIFGNNMPIASMNPKGSNSMAVSASRTTTGENYLLVNAHQPNTGSQAFYEAHLCSDEGLNVLGGLLAGGPCILHGVNEHLGWAHTVNYCDRLDVYQLQTDDAHPGQYNFDGDWIPLEQKKIKLHIKGVPVAISKTVYWSKYGPTMKNKSGYFAMRLGADMRIGALDEWYHMDKARNYTEFYAALSKQELSMFNIMYADNRDTIFYVNNALMPIRDQIHGYNWKQTLPGNTSNSLWTEFRPLNKLPQYVNPGSGFLFNTNHSSFLATAPGFNLEPTNYSTADGWESWHNNRSKRLMEEMPAEGKISFEQFKRIKFDRQLPAVLQYPYRIDSLVGLDPAAHPEYADLINTLKQWDKKGDPDSKGGAVFILVYNYLAKKLQGQGSRAITVAESLETLQYVKDYMLKYFGRTDLVLGDIQKLVRGDKTWPLGGFQDLLSPQWTEPYKNGMLKSTGGDGYIMFIRFPKDQLPVIETVNMYGASARPGNQHFDDQVPLYLKQETKHMTLDKKEVYAGAERVYHPGE